MKFYRVDQQEGSPDCNVFVTSLEEARKVAKDTARREGRHVGIFECHVHANRRGLLLALNNEVHGDIVEEWRPVDGQPPHVSYEDPQFPVYTYRIERRSV